MELTYELLDEVYRKEKNDTGLCNLEPEFFRAAREYLEYKAKMSHDDAGMRELHNAMYLVRKIYEARTKKIWISVLRASLAKAGVDTSAMLPFEKDLYDCLIPAADEHRLYMYKEIMPQKITIAKR